MWSCLTQCLFKANTVVIIIHACRFSLFKERSDVASNSPASAVQVLVLVVVYWPPRGFARDWVFVVSNCIMGLFWGTLNPLSPNSDHYHTLSRD